MSMAEKIYSVVMKRSYEAEEALPPEVQDNVAPNGLKQVSAQALQSSGDQLVNASTVLPWLFAALGVPAALTGLLVPIRESGSMLPQAALTPLVLKVRYRKWIFVVGSLIQAASVFAMALAAAFATGLTAGLWIIAALAVFSLGRCLNSISSKDVLGRTIPKGERGQINGLSTTIGGIVAITVGLAVRVFGGEDLSAAAIGWFLVVGGALWLGVALVYSLIKEPAGEAEDNDDDAAGSTGWFRDSIRLLREDKPFRNFVGVRSLLLVSSLAPPFIVTLSIQQGSSGLAGLGSFILASGVARMLGGQTFGRFADRSSKTLMSLGAGFASAVVILTVALAAIPAFSGEGWMGTALFVVAYFLLTFMHTGVRVGRKTYVVDMAEGDQRTTYVAVSNSAMGIILLIVGAISSALAVAHVNWALLFLALMGLVGVFAGAKLPDVSKG